MCGISWQNEIFGMRLCSTSKGCRACRKVFHDKAISNFLGPDRNAATELDFIVPRVLELTYTAHDLGYDGLPYAWNPERRAMLRAELDAYYAKLYGLTRDELRYILDPADVYGEDYPTETFRGLKNNDVRQFGEYRTRRLVLEAWDQLPGP
jgi:hypothetical protein